MKNKMMKCIAVVLAMVICFGMTVFAEETKSPDGSDSVVGGISAGTDSAGKDLINGDIRIVVRPVPESVMPEKWQSVANHIKTQAGLNEAIAQSGITKDINWSVASVVDVEVLGYGQYADCSPEELREMISWPVTITFDLKGVVPSTKIQILHWVESKQSWEAIPTTVGTGTVTGVFNSLSPVAFLVESSTMASGTSPKTSASHTPVIALIGICAAVAAFGMKKRMHA